MRKRPFNSAEYERNMLLKLCLDRHFIAAVVIAPLVWISIGLLAHISDLILLPTPTFSLQLLWFSALLYPVLEELTFRGLLQHYLLKIIPRKKQQLHYTPSAANILTSVIFTLCHWYLVNPNLISLLIFLPSLIFGHLRERFDSVIPAIFLHMFYNGGFILTLLLLNTHNIY